MQGNLLTAMRAAHLGLWALAFLNILAKSLCAPLVDALGGDVLDGLVVRNALNQVQLILLGLIAAFLCRPAVGVFVILGLTSLNEICLQLSGSYFYPQWPSNDLWRFLSTARYPLVYLSIFHGLRLCFGWRISREPELAARQLGQFQIRDLLEWMFTIAATLGVFSLQAAIFPNLLASSMYFWLDYRSFALVLTPLVCVLLSERIRLRWFCAAAALWIVVHLGDFCYWSFWRNLPMLGESFRFCLHRAVMTMTIVSNSLALRCWGYRWRRPVRQAAAN